MNLTLASSINQQAKAAKARRNIGDSSLNKGQLMMLAAIVLRLNNGKTAVMTGRALLAKITGNSTTYVSELTNQLQQKGLITKKRVFNKASIYIVNIKKIHQKLGIKTQSQTPQHFDISKPAPDLSNYPFNHVFGAWYVTNGLIRILSDKWGLNRDLVKQCIVKIWHETSNKLLTSPELWIQKCFETLIKDTPADELLNVIYGE